MFLRLFYSVLLTFLFVFVSFLSHFLFCFIIFKPKKEKFRREFGIAMKCYSSGADRRHRRQERATQNMSPSPSVVTSLTRTPKQYQRQPSGFFGSQQPRRSSSKSGNSSPIFKGKSGTSPSAEMILLCTMPSSTYTAVNTIKK